jgi:polysaccharide export outer membrane protein
MKDRKGIRARAGLAHAARVIYACGMAALVLLPALATAQQPSANKAAAESAPRTEPAANAQDDERYRIGPGDLLDIRVLNRPQISRDAVRVDGRGMIRMPFVRDEIQAGCRTESELAGEIAAAYLKYLKNPQVDVFIKEYNSQPVAVIGAVNAPGRFQLQRRLRLLDLLAFAGGPADRAGRSLQVVHASTAPLCDSPAAGDDVAEGLSSYTLGETLRGEARANPYVQPGDVITLPDAEEVYVVGNVVRPAALPIKEPITVSRAIAMVGGVLPDTKSDRVRIVRQMPGGASKKEIFVDLKAIDKRQAEDVALMANDIVDVPASGGKRLLRSLVGAIVPSVSQLPVRVIPVPQTRR